MADHTTNTTPVPPKIRSGRANHITNLDDLVDELARNLRSRFIQDDTDKKELSAQYISDDIEELDKIAARTQAAINTTLALNESEMANLQAEEAVKQGKTVVVFTLVTVWFPPITL
ncbi:hypothetical protein LCI18_012767 [Fusarium solani-melongenae]|uniref:Uncharacterized protein n=1 Tax=Fusarium solani subsp. cucurbitae TaxID=2747967 RepID=A0ACD3ZLK3_FUSSC|nr:hypothetical protein LCI18_012767 [Fusarium solani-melongenae]